MSLYLFRLSLFGLGKPTFRHRIHVSAFVRKVRADNDTEFDRLWSPVTKHGIFLGTQQRKHEHSKVHVHVKENIYKNGFFMPGLRSHRY